MQWKFDSDRPIYTQLVDGLRLQIVSGVYPPGERLPSVRDLASQAAVNPNTMQRALAELERQDLIHTQRTSGRTVTEDAQRVQDTRECLAQAQVKEFLARMQELGYTAGEAGAYLAKAVKEAEA